MLYRAELNDKLSESEVSKQLYKPTELEQGFSLMYRQVENFRRSLGIAHI